MPELDAVANKFNKRVKFPNVLVRKIEDLKVQEFILEIYRLFGADLDGDVMSIADMVKKLVENTYESLS